MISVGVTILFIVLATCVRGFNINSAQTVLQSKEPSVAPTPKIGCMLFKCGFKLAQCMLDGQCRVCSQCMKDCPADQGVDAYQKCTSNCFFLYSNEQFNDFTGCMLSNKCIPEMTWSEQKCPSPQKLDRRDIRVNKFDWQLLAQTGVMYVARGSHEIYDCFPCQRLNYSYATENTQTGAQTVWSTDLYSLVSGKSLGDQVNTGQYVRNASYVLKQFNDNTLWTQYDLFGMQVTEYYYVLDYELDPLDNSKLKYMVYFYCGSGFGGEYQGALVYTNKPNTQIEPELEQRLKKVLVDMDLAEYYPPLNQFCQPAYGSSCHNI
ncbi:hypothetical protein MP228_000713 [Amoeboaphelidium protococcarum]|nr:hypothetical protein MP228_000713 [Amoeboaphelidium protococcarum]